MYQWLTTFNSAKSGKNIATKYPEKKRVDLCPNCARTAERNFNAAKNIESWFEGIFIPGRSHKKASYAKIARAGDKHLVASA